MLTWIVQPRVEWQVPITVFKCGYVYKTAQTPLVDEILQSMQKDTNLNKCDECDEAIIKQNELCGTYQEKYAHLS